MSSSSPVNYNAANIALNLLLRKNPNKFVVCYTPHDILPMREFFASREFWDVLKKNGFTQNYVERTPELEAVAESIADFYVQHGQMPAPHIPSSPEQMLKEKYLTAARVVAKRRGVTTRYVDMGSEIYPPEVEAAFNNLFYCRGDIISSLPQPSMIDTPKGEDPLPYIQKMYDQIAEAVRSRLATPEGADLQKAYERFSKIEKFRLARFDDEATGKFAAELAAQSNGRAWLEIGRDHFTPVGVHTHLDNPLILVVFNDYADYLCRRAAAQHQDIFADENINKPAWTTCHVLTLKDGRIREWSAEPVAEDVIEATRANFAKRVQEAQELISLYK